MMFLGLKMQIYTFFYLDPLYFCTSCEYFYIYRSITCLFRLNNHEKDKKTAGFTPTVKNCMCLRPIPSLPQNIYRKAEWSQSL